MSTRLLPLVGFLALFALLGFGIWWNTSHDPEAVPSPLIGKPAPAFSLPLLDDPARLVDATRFRGKPYLINVFASWCFACRDEHPVLMAHKGQFGVPLVGYDYKDQPADAKRWLDTYGDPYDLVIADQSGSTAIDFGIYGAPETFLIDGDGIIRYKHIGPMTADDIARVIKPRIAALEGGKAP